MRLSLLFTLLLLYLFSSGCSSRPLSEAVVQTTLPPPTIEITATSTHTATLVPTFSPTRLHDTPTPFLNLCSPLQGYSYSDLEAAISNPFNPPKFGSDDPHQGVDLAVKQGEMALSGEPVYAVMGGMVVAVVNERFPYGNAIMIETQLIDLHEGWAGEIQVPTPAPTLGPHPSLTCPEISPLMALNSEQRSLYLLYAHLLEPVNYAIGEMVKCGDFIGKIGQSGNALNPHLHLEARVGPSDATFNSLAHYDARVSQEEMYYYCVWRVSGIFQLLDPLSILGLLK